MFKEFLNRNKITDKRIAVGVSGGSDSLALMLMAHQELVSLGYTIIALTVDHQLRPSSADEALYVGEIAARFGIEHHILIWEDEKPQSSFEEAARAARYELIGDWCEENNVKAVMMAHHLNDQVETFFIRLQRGSGLDGLCGMREVVDHKGLTILRPLLNQNPQMMKDFLLKLNIRWIEDESNQCLDFLRAKIRHLLPQFYEDFGLTPQKIADTMLRLQSSRDYLDKKIYKIINRNGGRWDDYCYSFPYAEFIKQEPEIQYRLLAYMLRNTAHTEYQPRASTILNLLSKIAKKNFSGATGGHCYINRLDNKLWIFPEEYELGKYNTRSWKEFLATHKSYFKLHLPFRLRVYLVNRPDNTD